MLSNNQTDSNNDDDDDGCRNILATHKHTNTHKHTQPEYHYNHEIREYSFDKDFIQIYELHSSVFSYSKERLPTIEELKKMKGYVTTISTTFGDIISGYILYSKSDINEYYKKKHVDDVDVNKNVESIESIYLDYIGVNPLYQGQGIGKILMNTFLDFTSRMRFTSILDVEKDTPHTNTLVSWYTKNGFYVFVEHKEDNIDLVCMIRLFC